MGSIQEREEQRKKSIVGSFIEAAKPKAEDQDPIVQRGYYLHESVVKVLKVTAAQEGRSASEILEQALKQFLKIK